MAFRYSFASVPLQVTSSRGLKALAALTEHYIPCAAVLCSGYSSFRYVRPSPGLNVAKQPDFSIRHRTLLRYRFVHVRRHHDSTCNALQPCPFHDIEPRHRFEVIAPFVLDTGPIPSSIRTVPVYVIESISNCFDCVWAMENGL